MKHVAPNGPATTKPSDVVVPAIPKPIDGQPKNERDVEAGEKPSELPKKEGDVEMDADLKELNT